MTRKRLTAQRRNDLYDLEIFSRDAVNPDGIRIHINWENFVIGSSVFIPAINTKKLRKQMWAYGREKNMYFKSVERIEGGKLGMRFWRTK